MLIALFFISSHLLKFITKVKQIKRYIDENYNVVIWPSDIKEKDINELISSGKTERDVKDIIARNTFNGLLARTKLSEWKRI